MLWRKTLLSGLASAFLILPALDAFADGLDNKQIQIVAKIFNFLAKKPPSGAVVLVLPGAADLNAVRKSLGKLSVIEGGSTLAASAFAVFVNSTTEAEAVASANAGAIVIGPDVACVDAGWCLIAVETQPKISIYESQAAAAKAGIGFDPNFKMLITER